MAGCFAFLREKRLTLTGWPYGFAMLLTHVCFLALSFLMLSAKILRAKHRKLEVKAQKMHIQGWSVIRADPSVVRTLTESG
jgi:hypothetical protein